MDLNELLVFTRVVEAGSFTAAARELDMPKSTVSRKVSQLESRLGARLLQRTTRRLDLTEVGRTYYEHCARVVAEVEEAERAVTRMHGTPRGVLRVTAPLSFSQLGPVVAAFLQRHPAVQLEIVCTDRVVDLLEEHFDVAVRAGTLADSSLIVRTLGTSRRVLVASPAYLERRGAPEQPGELASHRCMAFGAGADRAVWKLVSGAVSLAVHPKACLVVNDFDMLREAAIAGLGIAELPEDRCAADIDADRLRRVLPDWASGNTPVHAVYPSSRHLSPKVKAFIDHLAARAGATGPQPKGP